MMQMSVRLMRAYHKQIGRLHAAEDLRSLRVTLASRMKPEQIDALIRELREEINPDAGHKIFTDWGDFRSAIQQHLGGPR